MGEEKSVIAFRKIHGESVGKWLMDAGYYTAFLGKYVNAILRHEDYFPKGWRYFGAFTEDWDFYKKRYVGGQYTYYNTSQWDLNFDENGELMPNYESDYLKMCPHPKSKQYPINIWEDVHQVDFLGAQTLEIVQRSVDFNMPFF